MRRFLKEAIGLFFKSAFKSALYTEAPAIRTICKWEDENGGQKPPEASGTFIYAFKRQVKESGLFRI